MKQILLSSLLTLCAVFAFAQAKLDVYDEHDNLITDKTINVYAKTNEIITLDAHLKIKNTGTIDLNNIYVKKNVLRNTGHAINNFCFGFLCYPASTLVSSIKVELPVGEINDTFIGDDTCYGYASTVVRYDFFDKETTGDSVIARVTVNYTNGPEIEFINHEGVVLNDSTIEISSNDAFAYLAPEFYARVNTPDTLYMWARKITTYAVPGASIMFCFGGNCFPTETDSSFTEYAFAPGVNEIFLVEYQPNGNSGQTSLTFELFDLISFNEKVAAQFLVNFAISPNGDFDDQKYYFSEPFPNPATSKTSFKYSLPSSNGNSRIVFRNMLGQIVLNNSINSSDDRLSVDLAALKSGLYMYSVIIDDKVFTTGKLIVK